MPSAAIDRSVASRFCAPAVMFINGRGDYLMNLPALRSLATMFEDRLTFVSKPGVRNLFYSDLAFARVIDVDCWPGSRGPEFDADTLADALVGCDLFLSLNPWHTPSLDRLVARLTRVPAIGFSSRFSLPLLLDFSKHSVDLAFDVVRCVSEQAKVEQFAAPPRFPARYEALALALRAALPPTAHVVVVHGDTKPEKTWSAHRFAEVIRWLLARDPNLYVFDVGLNRADNGALAGDPRVISCRELVLPAALALTGIAGLFIGVDSCFLHASDLYRVPGVGLFGATAGDEFGFRFGPHRHVGASSMAAIGSDDVISAIESLLREHPLG